MEGIEPRKFIWALLALLAEAALQVSGYENVPLAIALVVLFVLLLIYAVWPRAKRGIPPASTQRPASDRDESKPEDRVFIDVTPAYLVSLFEGHTHIQAAKLAEAYVGKWMKVSGRLGDVMRSEVAQTFSQVTFKRSSVFDAGGEHFGVFMYFDGTWDDRVAVLRRGDSITVIGQLERVNRDGVHLGNCELVDWVGQVTRQAEQRASD